MRRLVLALAALAVVAAPALAAAAEVSGSVVDPSGAVLPGATVAASGPSGTRTAYTRADGRFTIQRLAPGTYKLTVTLAGFASATREDVAVGETPVDVGAIPMAIAGIGETVVVSASKVETKLVDAPATMSVIGTDTLATTPAQNFGDLLRSVPGMNVIQTSARDVQLTSRQATSTLSTSTLVLLDGRSIYQDFFGFVIWDLVPTNPADIKQVEVVRGPASAVWGANALTGVVNIITKTPREAEGTTISLQGGSFNRDGGSREPDGSGAAWGGNLTLARAPNETWSYRLTAGYFDSDAYSRPVGRVPVSTHPLDSTIVTGGAPYPADSTGTGNFQNSGTAQPKFDLRVDQDLSGGGRLSYSGGYAGTEGIIHTGIGPFDIESGSYMGYGRVGFVKDAFKVAGFVNWLDVKAPNLLLTDPATLEPVRLNFKTQTFDLEVGHSTVLGGRHVLSYGGNARRNNFDITLASQAENRSEFGAYLQDEFHYGKFRLSLGARVDKYANIDDPVFSPRVTAMFKPTPDHALRISFNRAFRSPSAINNYLDQQIFAPSAIDLRALAPLAPPPLQAMISSPFNLIVRNVGNEIGSTTGTTTLKEEFVDAFEVAYTGTFGDKLSLGLAWYQNDQDDNINFASVLPSASFPRGVTPPLDFYTSANAPTVIGINQRGIPVSGPALIGFLSQVNPLLVAQGRAPIILPRTVSTYLNLGPIRQQGVEASLDYRFSNHVSLSANYSYQKTPEVLDAAEGQIPYPTEEVTVPAKNRFNATVSWNTSRLIGQASVNYSDDAFWNDVLTTPYHGYTDAYTMFNASFGVKWAGGKLITTLKGTNLFNEQIQQHVFGDIIRRAVFAELRYTF
jgi:iron complex outermembrane receptor protein